MNNYVTFIINDIIELYTIHRKSNIYKYYLIVKILILLYITSPNIISML